MISTAEMECTDDISKGASGKSPTRDEPRGPVVVVVGGHFYYIYLSPSRDLLIKPLVAH